MKKVGKKLSLSKETLRTLSGTALRGVLGGDSGGSDTSSARCPSGADVSWCVSCNSEHTVPPATQQL
jgi:hypothetical protein